MEGGSCSSSSSSKRRYSCGMTINRLQLTSEVKSATIFISLLYLRSECSPRLGSAAFRRQKTISSNYANVQAAVMATISSNLVHNRSLQRSYPLNTLSTNIQPFAMFLHLLAGARCLPSISNCERAVMRFN